MEPYYNCSHYFISHKNAVSPSTITESRFREGEEKEEDNPRDTSSRNSEMVSQLKIMGLFRMHEMPIRINRK